MSDTSDFRNGLILRFKNDLYAIVEFQHVKPGKGGAFVRTSLKNLKTGRVLDNTFRSGESVEIVRVERRKYQYLYKESSGLVLMDNETYDQITVAESYFGDGQYFLKESDIVDVLLDDNEQIITVEIPIFVNLMVEETEPGFKGDTATNTLKPAKMETGATVNVPLFVDTGDFIKVDTRTGTYVERVKN
ncbi:MAG: elongation factor P [Ignavibacteriales bacterium]|nr:elongation factor P [Ignavibacteriales bacterium]MCF8305400.1 elongation factor P [Ignavibacteriales bacterium]MCF8316083.1 elongation factor P [Ignavibacteriales bacterium]MCF8436585.1 elongation factor P [Ignavibacteriales bacterium]